MAEKLGGMAGGLGGMTRWPGGAAGWLIKRLRTGQAAQSRLTLLDRITLAPRQSLALVEAEGRRILVATSAEGGPAFFPLGDEQGLNAGQRTRARGDAGAKMHRPARVSW